MNQRIAIIGAGPRALGALEALARQDLQGWQVVVFDPVATPGAGPNFDPAQSPLCLLNLPIRAVDLPPSPAGFAEFADWLGEGGTDGERFPSRTELGAYLAARWQALAAAAPFSLDLQRARVQDAERDKDGWHLRTGDASHGPFAELLLTQGQPSTRPDKQLARWQEHAQATGATIMPAYPAGALLDAVRDWTGRNVAIRGLGLATLDVLRLLTLGAGGSFQDGRYLPSGREPARILPFSRDGLPPSPKPANAALDRAMAPTAQETDAFAETLTKALAGPDPVPTLSEALIAPARRILAAQGAEADEADIRRWLEQEREAPASQGPQEPVPALKAGIAMASGNMPPDPGYVIGQIWRHWQPNLRQGFDPAPPSPDTATALLAFDEPLKRYSYGPPLCGAQELLALVQAGLVDLRAADDPKVLLTDEGWQLVEADATARASVMVDAVLPAPDLDRIDDPLLAGLRDRDQIRARGKDLAVAVQPDGGAGAPGLAMLGRMTLGSVVAPDSIHDCFGASATRWAAGVAQRAAWTESARTYKEHS